MGEIVARGWPRATRHDARGQAICAAAFAAGALAAVQLPEYTAVAASLTAIVLAIAQQALP
jgi:hypothetical protein